MSYYANFLCWLYANPIKAGPARQLPENISSGKLNTENIPPSIIVVTQQVLDNVKLRHVVTKPQRKYFPPRNPVMQEILDKRYHKDNRFIVCQSVREYWKEKIIFIEDEDDDW